MVSLDSPQQHNFHAMGDEDWFKFDALASTTYSIQTSELTSNADTYVYLYDTDGTTLLASNDDAGDSLASSLEWTAPERRNLLRARTRLESKCRWVWNKLSTRIHYQTEALLCPVAARDTGSGSDPVPARQLDRLSGRAVHRWRFHQPDRQPGQRLAGGKLERHEQQQQHIDEQQPHHAGEQSHGRRKLHSRQQSTVQTGQSLSGPTTGLTFRPRSR